MFDSRARPTRSSLLLLIVLIMGQWLLPATAAACATCEAVAIVDRSIAHAVGDVVAADGVDTDESGRPDCCDDDACNDCCLHASAIPTVALKSPPVNFVRVAVVPLRLSVPPGDYPVSIRPPIRS